MLTDSPNFPNLDKLCSQKAYITGLDDFLNEADDAKSIRYWLDEFIVEKQIRKSQDIVLAIQRSISDIDHLINDQLNNIIHHQSFQQLEASWRGLKRLTDEAQDHSKIKIKVLDVKWHEVSRDISRALEFDQSQLFKKIYSEEYGSPGGQPYGVIIGDYQISHKTTSSLGGDSLSTLEGMSQIAAAAFAPFITGAGSELFGLDDFSSLANPVDLNSVFAQTEYIKWRELRSRPDSQFVGLTLPQILMRLPYRTTAGSYKGIFFQEQVNTRDSSNYCWGNSAYAFASVLIREFANVGWFGHIRGAQRNQGTPQKEWGGGLVFDLLSDSFSTDPIDLTIKPVTDVIISDNKERELSDLGLIPLCQCYDTTYAAFYSNQSLRQPQNLQTNSASINSRLSSMLQHVLCGSRFAHYIKVIIRDKVGSFISADECEDYLREWLFRYTTGREDLDWEEQARYPLREAAVDVKDHPEKPGEYLCVIHLRPHYQLDHLVSELELVTELAQSV